LATASFDTDPIAVGDASQLHVTFVDLASPLRVTIDAPESNYATDGTTEPTGDGAAYFTWTHLGNGQWQGIGTAALDNLYTPYGGENGTPLNLYLDYTGASSTSGSSVSTSVVFERQVFGSWTEYNPSISQSVGIEVTAAAPGCSDPDLYADNCDFDGDGINNIVDLDDDNDGVLDSEECPILSSASKAKQSQSPQKLLATMKPVTTQPYLGQG